MKIKIFIALTLLFLVGCTHRYKYYDFESADIPALGGNILIAVRGESREVSQEPQISEVKSPYVVRVFFSTHDAPKEDVHITVDQITSFSGQSIEIGKTETIQTDDQHWDDGKSRVSFYVGTFDLNHEPFVVEGSVTYKGETKRFKAKLETKYWSERRSNWFDGIMSI